MAVTSLSPLRSIQHKDAYGNVIGTCFSNRSQWRLLLTCAFFQPTLICPIRLATAGSVLLIPSEASKRRLKAIMRVGPCIAQVKLHFQEAFISKDVLELTFLPIFRHRPFSKL